MIKEILIIGMLILLVGCNNYLKSDELGTCFREKSSYEVCSIKLNKSITRTSTSDYNVINCCWNNLHHNDEQGYFVEQQCKGVLKEKMIEVMENKTWRYCVPNEWIEYS